MTTKTLRHFIPGSPGAPATVAMILPATDSPTNQTEHHTVPLAVADLYYEAGYEYFCTTVRPLVDNR